MGRPSGTLPSATTNAATTPAPQPGTAGSVADRVPQSAYESGATLDNGAGAAPPAVAAASLVHPWKLPRRQLADTIGPGVVDLVFLCRRGLFAGRFLYINRAEGEIFGSGKKDPNVSVVIEHARLSPRHCLVRFEPCRARFVLYDLGSETGTWVRLREDRGLALRPGALLELNGALFKIVVGDTPVDGVNLLIEFLSAYDLESLFHEIVHYLSLKKLKPSLGALGTVADSLFNHLVSNKQLLPEDIILIALALRNLNEHFLPIESKAAKLLLVSAEDENVVFASIGWGGAYLCLTGRHDTTLNSAFSSNSSADLDLKSDHPPNKSSGPQLGGSSGHFRPANDNATSTIPGGAAAPHQQREAGSGAEPPSVKECHADSRIIYNQTDGVAKRFFPDLFKGTAPASAVSAKLYSTATQSLVLNTLKTAVDTPAPPTTTTSRFQRFPSNRKSLIAQCLKARRQSGAESSGGFSFFAGSSPAPPLSSESVSERRKRLRKSIPNSQGDGFSVFNENEYPLFGRSSSLHETPWAPALETMAAFANDPPLFSFREDIQTAPLKRLTIETDPIHQAAPPPGLQKASTGIKKRTGLPPFCNGERRGRSDSAPALGGTRSLSLSLSASTERSSSQAARPSRSDRSTSLFPLVKKSSPSYELPTPPDSPSTALTASPGAAPPLERSHSGHSKSPCLLPPLLSLPESRYPSDFVEFRQRFYRWLSEGGRTSFSALESVKDVLSFSSPRYVNQALSASALRQLNELVVSDLQRDGKTPEPETTTTPDPSQVEEDEESQMAGAAPPPPPPPPSSLSKKLSTPAVENDALSGAFNVQLCPTFLPTDDPSCPVPPMGSTIIGTPLALPCLLSHGLGTTSEGGKAESLLLHTTTTDGTELLWEDITLSHPALNGLSFFTPSTTKDQKLIESVARAQEWLKRIRDTNWFEKVQRHLFKFSEDGETLQLITAEQLASDLSTTQGGTGAARAGDGLLILDHAQVNAALMQHYVRRKAPLTGEATTPTPPSPNRPVFILPRNCGSDVTLIVKYLDGNYELSIAELGNSTFQSPRSDSLTLCENLFLKLRPLRDQHYLLPGDVIRMGELEFAVLRFNTGVGGQQGLRHSMEDEDIVIQDMIDLCRNRHCSYFAVYDGHGGRQCAQFLRNQLHKAFRQQLFLLAGAPELAPSIERAVYDALFRSFVQTDRLFLQQQLRQRRRTGPGCAAVVVIVLGDTLWTANCGDARAVLCRNGTAIALSSDHKPVRPDEAYRIEASGGFVKARRVLGRLAVSRAFGDIEYKNIATGRPPLVIADPEIRTEKLTSADEFLLLACDGLFDVFSSQEAVDFVRWQLATMPQGEQDPQRVVQELIRNAIELRRSRDNVTAILVTFKRDIGINSSY